MKDKYMLHLLTSVSDLNERMLSPKKVFFSKLAPGGQKWTLVTLYDPYCDSWDIQTRNIPWDTS